MLFILVGPSYVGKKTAIAHFMKLYSFSSIIPYTTKPQTHRASETEGIQYHYVAEEDRGDIENNNYIYDEPFNYGEYHEKILYAYKKSDIVNAINSYSNFIIHASANNAFKIYSMYQSDENNRSTYTRTTDEKQLYIYFLNFSSALTEDFFRSKTPPSKKTETTSSFENNGGQADSFDFERRFSHAKKEIDFFRRHHDVFDEEIRSDRAYEICRLLEPAILPHLMVMPTSPDRIPGPLSDNDIVYMSTKRKIDPLVIKCDNHKLTNETELDPLLCGCGIHLTLSNRVRVVKKTLNGRFIDMAEKEHVLSSQLENMHPIRNISTGYVLKPNETILCSSNESIRLPHDVYAVVASKFSYTQLGLSIELSTSVIQSGHDGKIHFQIKNETKNFVCIYPNIQVAQLLFFRTVQPSSSNYIIENGDNQAYDKAEVAPVSKFRNGNNALNSIQFPPKGIVAKVYYGLEDLFVKKSIGVIVLILVIVLGLRTIDIDSVWREHFLPLIQNASLLLLIIAFAVFSSLTNAILYMIGEMIYSFIGWIYLSIHKIWRQK